MGPLSFFNSLSFFLRQILARMGSFLATVLWFTLSKKADRLKDIEEERWFKSVAWMRLFCADKNQKKSPKKSAFDSFYIEIAEWFWSHLFAKKFHHE